MPTPLLSSRLAASAVRASRAPKRLPLLPRRYASSSSSSSSGASSQQLGGAKAALYAGALAASLYVTYLYTTDTRAFVHRYVVPPLLRRVFTDAEDAHHAGTSALKLLYELNLHPRERGGVDDPAVLSSTVFGTQLANPVGISAGLDKDGEIPDVLFALGAAVVEIGGCTPLPQDGNPKPRVFRIPILDGMVNRYGLNSRGADDMAIRLRARQRRFARSAGYSVEEVLNGEAGVPPGSLQPGRLLAVQIAKNKDTDEKDEKAVTADYAFCARKLAPYADILVVNVSSPNTPGLRDLQAAEPLAKLLTVVVREAVSSSSSSARKTPPKVMVKVSPDEDEDAQIEGIVAAVQRSGVDGIIVGNTTKRRTGLVPPGIRLTIKEQRALEEQGGYSGPAMFGRTLDLVGRYRALLNAQPSAQGPQKILFATGGITTGEQALQVLNAGASVAMVYTGLVYGGAGTITRIKSEIKEAL